jgi:hypothetical protein
MNRRVTYMVLAGSALLVAVLFAADYLETPQKNIPSMQSAEAQDLAQKGWIPWSVPPEATSLELVWNIDTNARCGRFKHSGPWQPPGTRSAQQAPPEVPRLCARLANWPKAFGPDTVVTNSIETQRIGFAWDAKAGIGFFWAPR